MKHRSRLYRASAGTGKTHQLTNHYLRLACSGVAHDRIVASTFTRKAAGEILARVFARLARAASSEDEARKLDDQLGLKLGRSRYLARLEELARCIDGFRISTLDALFVLLAQALAGELGLPPEWSIADEVDLRRSRDESVAAALATLDVDEWGVLLRELERGADGRGVHSILTKTVEIAFALHTDSEAAAWDRLSLPLDATEEQLRSLPALVRALPTVPDSKGKPSSRFEPLRPKLELLVEREEFSAWVRSADGREALREYLDKGIGKSLSKGQLTFHGMPIPDEWIAVHDVLLRVLAADEAQRLVAHNRAARRLLDLYAERQIATRDRTRKLGFDEVARTLAHHASSGPQSLSTELEERLDARIDHLLLDEFQDTAPTQWRVLRRVAEELVQDPDGARTFFCVGDSKQSIYGWRAGEPRLLENMDQRLQPLDVEELNRSFRSSQVVLDAVNAVFEPKQPFSGFAGRIGYARALEAFASGYHRHVANDAGLPGVVRIHTGAEPLERFDRSLHCILRAVEVVGEIRALDARATIAILLRRNHFAALLLSKLRDAGIAASGEGGNPLVDAISVQAAVAALHWLEHPSDDVALYHAATSVLAPALGLTPELRGSGAASIHREQRRSLARLGVASWLAGLRGAVAERLGTWEQHRFAQLIDFCLAQPQGGSLDDLLERVRSERVEDANSASVKVMTVHASKGLEFDAVVLPELDQDWKVSSDAFYWRREQDDPERPIELVSRQVSEATRRTLARAGVVEPELLGELARERSMRDELSVLYVAMTRARCRLDLVLHPVGNKKGDPRCTPSGLLRERLGLGHKPLEPRSLVLALGATDDSWVAHLRARASAPVAARAPLATLAFAPSQKRRELERRSPSELGHDETVKTEKLFESVGNTPSQRRGSRFHRWFEEFEWLDNFARTDDELRALALEVDRDTEGLEKDLAEFRATLNKTNFVKHFTRPKGDVRVSRERRFRRLVGDALQSGSFDRVLFWHEGERVVKAEVLDFKTSKPEADLEQRREHYRPQLEAYREAVAAISGLPREKVQASLFFIEADEYMPVE